MSDWKQEITDNATKAVEHDLVQSVCRELADNLGVPFDGLPRYGIEKVAIYAASVAVTQTLGIDPDLLRLTPEEANSALLQQAAEAVAAGIPTFMVDPTEGSTR